MTNDLDSLEKDLEILTSVDPNINTLQRLEADQRLANSYPNMIAEIRELRKEIEKNSVALDIAKPSMDKPITENHLLSLRIKEKIDAELKKNPKLDIDKAFKECLLDELDHLHNSFYDLNQHVYRQEYLKNWKRIKK